MKSYIKSIDQIDFRHTAIAGGKGASLGDMTRAGLTVPPGFVVTAPTFASLLQSHGLASEITRIIAGLNPADTPATNTASRKLQQLVKSLTIPSDIRSELDAAHARLAASHVAVRSSAVAEDSADASWAGELESYLNVSSDQLADRIRDCWGSLFTPRALLYRHNHNLDPADLSIAVVVQAMVDADAAGVAFSTHPVTQNPGHIAIEAGLGLGEAVVSGAITPDNYVVDKSNQSIVQQFHGFQDRKLIRASQGTRWASVPDHLAGQPKLTFEQIARLAKLVAKIEAHQGYAVDVEWAAAGDNIYILQSRPITTLQ